MPNWILKGALQHVIGRLPKSYILNGLFQKYITRGYYPKRETFEHKLLCCRQHLDNYLRFSQKPKASFTAIELGTGSWPIVPIGLYLCGASEIWTYDLVPVLREDTLKATIELFCEFACTGELERILKTVHTQRVEYLKELFKWVEKDSSFDLLERLNIHLRIGDARNSALPNESIDLFFSTVVLEHIQADVLTGLLTEFRRMASQNAVMSHYVGLADQYASFDKSLTPYNFMKYSNHWWRIINNPIIPQSRLRLPDYRELFEQNGWHITEEKNISGSIDDFVKIVLAKEFQKYSEEDLLILFSWLVAKPSFGRSGAFQDGFSE